MRGLAFCFGQVGGAATFRWCGAAGEIHFTSVMLLRKQKRRILFTSEKPRQRDHRKRQSELPTAPKLSRFQIKQNNKKGKTK